MLLRYQSIDIAITFHRIALRLFPQGYPYRSSLSIKLERFLRIRFHRFGATTDLDEIITLLRSSMRLCPQEHPERPLMLNKLANHIYARFCVLGVTADLDEAITLSQGALQLPQKDEFDEVWSLSDLTRCFHARFETLGVMSDLEEAITHGRDVLRHSNKAPSFNNLAMCLHTRFDQLGIMSDLEEALFLYRRAVDLDPHRPVWLRNLAACLDTSFRQLGRVSDVEEAITLHRNALKLLPRRHPIRALALNSLSISLQARFDHLHVLSDIDEAITLNRKALTLQPQGHPRRAVSLCNLATCLSIRFDHLAVLADLDEAIACCTDALQLLQKGHPNRSHPLICLARCLRTRFEQSSAHADHDLEAVFAVYSKLSDVSQSVTSLDLEGAKEWVEAAEEHKHETTIFAYQTSLHLLVNYLTTLPSLPQHLSVLKELTTSLAIDAFSACIRYGNPTNGVELLEQGRGVFWSQLTRPRSPLDELIASGSEGKMLAEKFSQLSSHLQNILSSPPTSQHNQACHLTVQLQDIITEIRALPGLSRFLQPPLFSDLQHAASGGPVIIVNASQYGCDALVVLQDRDPVHVALQITKARVSDLSSQLQSLTSLAKVMDVTRELVILLRELWDDVVSPIVKVLEEFQPHRSRIWWCPTAEFCLLPIHAAGTYRKGQPNLSHLYISSYTPSLATLIRTRQKTPQDPPVEKQRVMVAGQAQAPGQNALASVGVELSSISQRLEPIATVTCIQGRDATVAKVAEELSKNVFVHLACHGIPDQKRPFQSGFALGDGMLRVEDIMRYTMHDAQFAYLSACHTMVGDEESPDEAIHLAAAMQFSGFRSVIGTMWAVDDAYTNAITSRFYEHLVDESGRLDHTRAALALHQSVRSLRDIPFDQRILYIHMGV